MGHASRVGDFVVTAEIARLRAQDHDVATEQTLRRLEAVRIGAGDGDAGTVGTKQTRGCQAEGTRSTRDEGGLVCRLRHTASSGPLGPRRARPHRLSREFAAPPERSPRMRRGGVH
jgi:hypothetical protein